MVKLFSIGLVTLLLLAATEAIIYSQDEHELHFLDLLVSTFNENETNAVYDRELSLEADKFADTCVFRSGPYETENPKPAYKHVMLLSYDRSNVLRSAYLTWSINYAMYLLCRTGLCYPSETSVNLIELDCKPSWFI
ncbi:hypothetical protein HELRODRAFT_159361 [Helobdella robusta]|uniref:Uncharacterized protein n=1 Tax=Helobdella robusta TaxID=6412 RepID=T1ENX8_HELRO|nr:hypothetical protein HELRODRAFT_159361 [Helobdella robusta]ESO12776.1 hypothetical protein HELRODRAFT_159361 [Helobdella robusta]